MKKERFQFR